MHFSENTDDILVNKSNIDQLYDINRKQDLQKLKTYTKILNSIHKHITREAAKSATDKTCYFCVPSIVYGHPKYSQGECIAFCIDKLKTDKYMVSYIPPETLFISWANYYPQYVREKYKREFGITIDYTGKQIEEKQDENHVSFTDDEIFIMDQKNNLRPALKEKTKYTSVSSYKPTGGLVYDDKIISGVESRLKRG